MDEALSKALHEEFDTLAETIKLLKAEQAKVMMTLTVLGKIVDKGGQGLQEIQERLEGLAKAVKEGRLAEFREQEEDETGTTAAPPDPALLSYWVDHTESSPSACYCPRHSVMKLKRPITPDMEGMECTDDGSGNGCGSEIQKGRWVLPPKQQA